MAKQVYIENLGTRVVTTKSFANGVETGSFIFLPGMNIVDADLYNKIRKDLKRKFDLKEFKEHFIEKKEPGKDGKEAKVQSTDFKELDLDKAEALVEKLNNIKALEALKKGESRDSIRAAIGAQLDNLEKFKKKGKKKQLEE